jgi:tetratricopeptide (TPR) repeat protein
MDFKDTNLMSYHDIELQFEKLSLEFGHPIKPDEAYINNCGYKELRAGNLQGAMQLFRQNIKYFPASFNVYDSLAEALLQGGDRNAAISNYEKSLALNPKNKNALDMLKKLKKIPVGDR